MGKYFTSGKYFNTSKYFDESRLPVESRVKILESGLKHSGVDVAPMQQRSALDRILDGLSVGNYTVMGGLRNLTDNDPNTGFWQGVGEGFKAANPFGEGYEKGEAGFRDVLSNMGWKGDTKKPWYDPNNLAHGVVSLAGDVLLDPTTYLSFGTGALLKGTGKTLAGTGARELAKKAFEESVQKAGKGAFKEVLEKAGLDAGDDAAEALINKVRRTAKLQDATGHGLSWGIGNKRLTAISDKALREIGDRTIAPYVNTALDAIGQNKYFKTVSDGVTKLFQSKKGIAAMAAARENPLEYAKTLTDLEMYNPTFFKKYAQFVNEYAQKVNENYAGVDDETRKRMTHLMENPDVYKRLVTDVEENTTDDWSAQAAQMIDDFKYERQRVDEILQAHKADKEFADQIKMYEGYKDMLDDILTHTSGKYESVAQKGSSATQFLRDKLPDEMYSFLNRVRNLSPDQIEKELVKEVGIEDAKRASMEIRAMLDRNQRDIDLTARRFFMGDVTAPRAERMDAGTPHTPSDLDGEVQRLLDEERQKYRDSVARDRANAPASSNAYEQQARNQRREQQAMRDLQNEAEMMNPWKKKEYFVEQAHAALKRGQSADSAKSFMERTEQQRMDNLMRRNAQAGESKERLQLISKILEGYDTTLPSAMGRKEREGLATKWADKLAKLDTTTLRGKVKDAEVYITQKAESEAQFLGKKKEIATQLAKYLVSGAKTTSGKENKASFKELYNKLMTKDYNELQRLAYQYQNENRNLKYFNAQREVDSGVKNADKIETERFNEKLNEQYDRSYPNEPDYNDWTDPDLDTFIDADIHTKGQGDNWRKQIADTVDNDFASNFGDKTAQHRFEVKGAQIFKEVDAPVDAKVSAIVDGLLRVGKSHPQIEKLMSTLKIYTANIPHWTDAISKRFGDDIIFGNKVERKGVNNADKYVAERVLPHEVGHKLGDQIKDMLWVKGEGDSKWLQAVQADGSALGKNIKVLATTAPDQWGEVKRFVDKKMIPEDMAESFAKYITNPKKFADEFPNRAKALQDALDSLNVPGSKVDMNVESKYFKFPKSAEQFRTEKLEELAQKRQDLLSKVNTMPMEDAVKRLEQIDQTMDNDFKNPVFTTLYQSLHPDSPIREFVTKRTEKWTYGLDTNNDAVKTFLAGYDAEQQQRIVKAFNFSMDEYKKIFDAEVSAGKMDASKEIKGYQPHIFREKPGEQILSEMGKDFDENKFGHERTIKTTIEKFNEWAKGKGAKQNVWEDDAAKLLMTRGVYSNALTWTDRYYRHIVDAFGIPFNKVDAIPAGKDVYASSELILDSLREIKDTTKRAETIEKMGLPKAFAKSLEIDDIYHNSVAPITKITRDQFIQLQGLNGKFNAFGLSDLVAHTINEAGTLQREDMTNTFLQLYDKALRLWKMNATSINPGFHARNFISNQFQNYLNVGSKIFDPKLQVTAAKITNPTARGSLTLGGKQYTMEEIREMATKLGVIGNGQFHDTTNVAEIPNPIRDALTGMLGEKGVKTLNKANPLSTKFLPYQIGGNVGSAVENQSRMLNFLANLDLGKDMYEAADNTKKFLFDYNDLSEFERNVMKRVVPFYTWMRKNMPLQMEQLVKNPNAYRAYAKVKHNVEPKEGRLAPEEKNKFAQDWFQMPFTSVGKSGDKEPTFWNPNLPLADLSKLPVSAGDAAETMISSLSPFIKLPMELATNKNTYFNTPISRGIGDSADAPGYLQGIMGGTKEHPAQIDPGLRHILRNIGVLENISKMTDIKNNDSERNMAIVKFVGGNSLYSFDVEKYKKWAFKDRLKQLQDLQNKHVAEQARLASK